MRSRLPFGDAVPAGNYALLRIEEKLIGILIEIFLAMGIFPVFAIDLLKENIQKIKNKNEINSFLDKQRIHFHQLISNQRVFVSNASTEPSFWWFKNDFSSISYNLIVQQQIDIFRMLHNIDTALICLSECSTTDEKELEFIKIQAANLTNLHNQLFDLSKQLNNCLKIWSNYFKLTQTRCYQLTQDFIPHRTELIQSDLLIHEQCLSDLNKTIYRPENEYQQGINRLFDHYFQRLNQDEQILTCVLYAQNQQADFILLA
ncbi:unnamed protein product [Didymodactylos carnosus]|uniref:Uncharacterized protein n=1 Tax=Didymodactylos carnosus TaxID=1234261 RepID=A0A813ZF52_9BILA|nr:unnamed protein product [Didymodactylos carnosus]CAF3680845.1 unnamed protein product [Didymodactylos carnosus]